MKSSETTEQSDSNSNGFSPPLTQPFQLVDWHVMPDRNVVKHRSNTKPRSIEPRLMQLLCFFAANPLTVIDRDTLVQYLWPNVIVNENSLTRAISELRKQLKGGCDKQTIETIPKRGYRLSQTISICNRVPEESPNPSLPRNQSTTLYRAITTGESNWKYPQLPVLTLAFAALLSVGVASNSGVLPTRAITSTAPIADEVLASTPDFLGGELELSSTETEFQVKASISEPIVSHDGRDIAYVSYNHAGSTIYIGTLNQMGEPYPVYHDSEKLINLSWSPVGRSLLFTKKPNITAAALFEAKSVNELLVLDVATGEVQRLVEDSLPRTGQTVSESNLT
ncbi:MAG: winged helix-turn-helix domain-containing protein [Pseudohongiellaceae bacterium]